MIILDVPSLPAYQDPGVIFVVLIVIFCLFLLALGIYLIIRYIKNKEKN